MLQKRKKINNALITLMFLALLIIGTYFISNRYKKESIYKDNIKVELYDDDLYSLKSYVEKNGYSKSSFYIGIDAAIILGCVGLNGIKKKISDEIDLLDKQEENYIS